MIEAGMGWGLVPELQVRGQLASGQYASSCCQINCIDVPLYWHHWRNGGQLLAELTDNLVRKAGQWLVPLQPE